MIYTSYFNNFDRYDDDVHINISRRPPAWFVGKSYMDVAPPTRLLNEFKSKRITKKQFVFMYVQYLNRLDPKKVAADLEGKICLCHEGTDKFCHREILKLWLNKHGFECEELL